MRLIKCVFCKVNHIVINLICRLLRNSIGNTAWYAFRFISINKVLTLFLHDCCFFLGHCTTYQVAPSKCITCQITHNLHNLLLIYDTSICRFQDRLQLRAVIFDRIRAIFSPDILRNKIHRPRTIQGNSRDHIFQALWFQFLHEVLHSRTFQLEHSIRMTCSKRIQYLLIIIINMLHIQLHTGILFYQMYRILDNCQCTKSQKVHFQKSQFFQSCHCKLGNDRTIRCSGKRYIF